MKPPTATLKMRLLSRQESGMDSWGQPVLEEVVIPVSGYFYQFGTEDSDRGGTVSAETGKVLMWPDGAPSHPRGWYAVEFDVLDTTHRWEIIGPPEPKFSLALGGQLNHWEFLVSRAAA